MLTPTQTESFRNDGYLFPLPAIDAGEAATHRASLEVLEREEPELPTADIHLLCRWAWDLVHDPRVVEPVSAVLGPDVLLWSVNWFIKEPAESENGGKFVSYHQDATYWGLEPYDVVTAWIALSDAGPETGPMKFIPGSHRQPILEHENTYDAANLLTRGQQVSEPFDEASAVLAPLKAGEMSIHHVGLIHGSEPNVSDDRRIGMVLRYCATHVRQTKIPRDTAVLVAGTDEFGHFDLMPAPEHDLGEAERAVHRDSVGCLTRAVMG